MAFSNIWTTAKNINPQSKTMIKTKEFMFVTTLIFVFVLISSNDASQRYLKYPPKRIVDGCDPRFPTAACHLPKPANPYTRGCSKITRCHRYPGTVPLLKKSL